MRVGKILIQGDMMIVVVTTENCGQCEGTKAFLKSIGKDFAQYNSEERPDLVQKAKDAGIRSFPIVMKGSEMWGGFDMLRLKNL